MPDGLAGFARIKPLNDTQRGALNEINDAVEPGGRHLLTGYAGSGKTTLIQGLVHDWLHGQKRRKRDKRPDVIVAAPTHAAVKVLSGKLADAGLGDVPCRTLHSILGLRPKMVGDRQIFIRDKSARPIEADRLICDECSMLGAEMMQHTRRHLSMAFVLFAGDPAQLRPVGEEASESFQIKSHSHLDGVVRQAADNPIIKVATKMREAQNGAVDWSWVKPDNDGKAGVFVPRPGARFGPDDWLKKAFTSGEFDADPNAFRYLAYTNARVAKINAQVRAWRYGPDVATPFVPGERAMFRSPLMRSDDILFASNEEVEVLAIEPGTFRQTIPECGKHEAWEAVVPSWVLTVPMAEGLTTEVHAPVDQALFNAICARIADEAVGHGKRWEHLQRFKGSMALVVPVYSITIHSSQGATYGRVFLDLQGIRARAASDAIEAMQLAYVGATRPTTALMLMGV